MISKELLEIVLDYKNIISINIVGNNICTIRKNDNCILSETHNNISIYEFAYKCKEWVIKNGCFIFSGYNGNYNCFINNSSIRFYADTEVEAIFKASEWILNNTGREDMNGN